MLHGIIYAGGRDRRGRPACLCNKSRPRAHNPNKWGPQMILMRMDRFPHKRVVLHYSNALEENTLRNEYLNSVSHDHTNCNLGREIQHGGMVHSSTRDEYDWEFRSDTKRLPISYLYYILLYVTFCGKCNYCCFCCLQCFVLRELSLTGHVVAHPNSLIFFQGKNSKVNCKIRMCQGSLLRARSVSADFCTCRLWYEPSHYQGV